MMENGVTMVRHPEVASETKGYCYGVTDVGLSERGLESIPVIAARLKEPLPSRVYHSGLTRARLLAESIAATADCDLLLDERFQELDFGRWENQSWNAIFEDAGDDIARTIHEPDHFSPPEGETVHQLRDRVLAGLRDIHSAQFEGRTIVVAHGGPISAMRGVLAGQPANQWPGLVPLYGEAVHFTPPEVATILRA